MLAVGRNRSPGSPTIHRCTTGRTPYKNSPLTCHQCPHNKIAPAQWRRVAWNQTQHNPHPSRHSLRHNAEARPPPCTAPPVTPPTPPILNPGLPAPPHPVPCRPPTPRAASLCSLLHTNAVPPWAGGHSNGFPGKDGSYRYLVVISRVEHGTERGRGNAAGTRQGFAQKIFAVIDGAVRWSCQALIFLEGSQRLAPLNRGCNPCVDIAQS